MAIYIAETREPFAPAPTASQATLAGSAAYGRLCSELTRYVKGEISGRSFLISGHRGAGKTTLVLKAIEDTRFRMKNLGSRPLMIPLHGPDLLLPPGVSDSAQTRKDADSAKDTDSAESAASAKNANGAEDADKNADKKTEASPKPTSTPANGKPANGKKAEAAPPASTTASDTEQFLRQVTIGIYRALADLFHEAYLRAAQWSAGTGLPAWRDLPELAAQLRIELDGAPDVGLLREFWRRAGALEVGIIALAQYDQIATPPGMAIEPPPSSPAMVPNRGMLELVALSSASQAYKVVSGELKTKEGQKQGATQNQSVAFTTVGQVKNLLNPLLGALAGGAVGIGLKSAQISTMVAALAGTATGLGTALTLNYSSSRSRENTRSTEMTFLPDTKITSLDRVLPLLVNRCRQAGIAPVFVVDELDKVSPNLKERMGPLVQHLKSLVTEKSFFCFLADRSYLEGLRRDLVTTPYRTEYTYFSDRLFVLYRPSDLHKYLSGESDKNVSGLLQPGDRNNSSEMTDLQLLPYVLLHRSRMHPFDLRRQLGRMRNDQGAISLPPGAVRTELAYRFDILIQVAVEWLLEQKELQERLSQDEDFRQLVYDTLYYPSRMWEQGSAELDVSRKAFFKYLGERMSPNLGQNKDEDGKKKQQEESCPLSDLDQDFLYARLRELLGFLVEPGGLVTTIQSTNPKRFPSDVLQAIPLRPKFRLLDFRDNTREICVWRTDLFGRSVEPPGINVVSGDMKPREKFIQSMQTALSAIGLNVTLDRLATEFKVLSATPAWASVQPAMRRLQRLWTDERPEPYGEMESDSNAVWEYSQMLRASGVALAEALVAGMVLGQIAGAVEGAGANMQEQKLLQGLSILSERLALRGLSPADTARQLQRVMQELKTALPWLQFDEASFNLNVVSVEQWAQAIKNALGDPKMNALNRQAPEVVAANNEQKWRERFRDYFRNGTTVFEATAVDLFCAAAWTGLSALTMDLSEVTIANWSELLLRSFGDVIKYPGRTDLPPIFGFPALFQLGFGKLATDALNMGRIFQEPSVAPLRFQSLLGERNEIYEWVFSASVRKPAVEMPGVLVVLDGPDPPLDWKTSAKYAAVVVYKADLPQWRQALQWTQSMFSRLVVEVVPTPQISAQVQQAPADVGTAYPEVSGLPYSYFSRTAPPVPVPSTLPFVSSPKTLDEAVDSTTPATRISTNAAPA